MDSAAMTHLFFVILSAVIAFFIVLILFIAVYKIRHLKTLTFKPELRQKAELIDGKIFMTQDQYELSWMGNISKESKQIIVGVHELGMNKENFLSIAKFFESNKDISFVGYDQRNMGKNPKELKPNSGSLIFDLNDIVADIHERYPNQKITLLGEGFGYYVSVLVAMKNPNVENIIGVGPITRTPYKMPTVNQIAIGTSVIFSHYRSVPINGIGVDLTNDVNFEKIINNNLSEKGYISIKEHYQNKVIAKRAKKSLNKLHSRQLIVQPKNDVYLDPNGFENMIKHSIQSNLTVEYIAEAKHFVLNDTKKKEAFEIINKWVNQNAK